jgi:16S rRNA processing protein RimM
LTKAYLPLGLVVGTHGVRGELRVQPQCDGAQFARQFATLYWSADGNEAVRVKNIREHKNVLLFVLSGVESVAAAEALRGRTLWFCRADAKLEEDAVFIAELIGCAAVHADTGEPLGTITDVEQYPANDIWHIVPPGGGEVLFPAVASMIAQIDTPAGVVRLRPIAGLFD